MATVTVNLSSSCIGSLSNINANASTGSYYQTPSVSKGGGTLQIYVPINLLTATGYAASNVKKITFKYEIAQERYGVFSSAGTVSTGYKNSGGSYTEVKNHANGIGKGTSSYEPYSDEITSFYVSGNTVTLGMKITNVIASQTCYYRIRNVSFVIEYDIPHSHSYTSTVTKEPTCTATGVRTYTCSCGHSYTETIAALGHDYKSVVTAPTANSAGYTTHTCSRCGDSYKNDYKYLVSVVASPTEGGTVSGAGTYNQGSTATITATANTGYRFVQWNDGNKNATRTITVSSSTTYTATFEKLTYTISTIVEPDGAGKVRMYRDEPNYDDSYIFQYGSATFDYGAKVDLVADDTEGYKFSYWKEDNYNRRLKEITVTGDATFTAVFKKLTQVYSAKSLTQPYSGNKKIAVYVGNTKI